MRKPAGDTESLPVIIISEDDQDRLFDLAYAYEKRAPQVSETLLAELNRAEVRSEDDMPATVVGMGSTVHFKAEDGQDRTVTLVYPGQADIEAGKISVATPVGAALIGLTVGQSFRWAGRDGQGHLLTVVAVERKPAA
ncbi:nucleoside diphosphate kinase regulator [Sphingomonas sp. C3-2]|uniref:nucleoside diphosphate kinase regulator n=1 Tax=Sphingomonas sp. C3-2 TaxID=3062169 RepID=UPI00294AE993|nr:nucleoside diphosphate kinase regulator [Sphingomonas sp. C3-2]WOK38106.1 nucleoside diphosphate kinase regulator [Sphingomonas sp. C3-2]